jgi:hypothetical protein
MSTHPDLEAYILGQHDDLDTIEAHIAGCDTCLAEVGRQARLELLLHAAGREDAFAAVVVPARRPRRWPLFAAAGVAVVAAAGAGAYALWRPEATSGKIAASLTGVTRRHEMPGVPTWASGLQPNTARCSESDGDLTCAASSSDSTRDDAEDEAADRAVEALLEQALARGDDALRAQRELYRPFRERALASLDREWAHRALHAVASHVRLGHRDTWYWEEYEKLDGSGTEFLVFVRFSASAHEIDDLLAGYAPATIEGAELAPIVPGIRWLFDPGDQMAWFVHRPGRLPGVRARDFLVHDSRRRVIDLRTMLLRQEAKIVRGSWLR